MSPSPSSSRPGQTPRPIRRLLIANRGEIAVRIARTARAMGIATVGVHSDADASALHTDVVDFSVSLGGESAAESYLQADAVIAAATATGCDAVHPGYGFLAERPDVAQAVLDAGLIWIGPDPEHIALLGDKMAAKAAAGAAGVPTSVVFDHAELSTAGTNGDGEMTFPLLVKAAAGGGGRGMRVVHSAAELPDAVASASREAEAAFGDGTVFGEPFFDQGRHIEVQIFGDRHGNVIHLGERDCSIQRRNQKIIEEAPAPGLDSATRQTLLDAAVALGRHVGYVNAGTVEFLVGADGAINFLEVNTRLQVEHPVTEAVTGLDLVELQLRVAGGERLPAGPVVIEGHAIEARLVAEAPAQGWLPATGQLEVFDLEPKSDSSIRVDAGFRAGDVVTPHYDSLLAKVIAFGPTRTAAASVLARHLDSCPIAGVATNRETLSSILGEDDFLAGRLTTSYLAEHQETVADPGPHRQSEAVLILAATMYLDKLRRHEDKVTGFAPSGWRNVPTIGQRVVWRKDPAHAAGNEEPIAVEYQSCGHGTSPGVTVSARIGPFPVPLEDGTMPPDDDRAAHDIKVLSVSAESAGGPSGVDGVGLIAIDVDGIRHRIRIDHRVVAPTGAGAGSDQAVDLIVASSAVGSLALRQVPRFETPILDGASGSGPICPLPGTVIAVHVEVGQIVGDGDVLVVVEAMKMEHKITATAPATVSQLPYSVGDRVDAGDLLVNLEALEP